MNQIVPSARAKLKRLAKRGAYDRATVHAVLDASVVCHIAYVLDGQPYCTPDRLLARRRPAVLARLLGQPDAAGAGRPACRSA